VFQNSRDIPRVKTEVYTWDLSKVGSNFKSPISAEAFSGSAQSVPLSKAEACQFQRSIIARTFSRFRQSFHNWHGGTPPKVGYHL
jgi:hypothetical protein